MNKRTNATTTILEVNDHGLLPFGAMSEILDAALAECRSIGCSIRRRACREAVVIRELEGWWSENSSGSELSRDMVADALADVVHDYCDGCWRHERDLKALMVFKAKTYGLLKPRLDLIAA